jgi:hypothetical protein
MIPNIQTSLDQGETQGETGRLVSGELTRVLRILDIQIITSHQDMENITKIEGVTTRHQKKLLNVKG